MRNEALPRHIAIIMDGNRRWAKRHRLKAALGHRSGVETLREIIRECSHLSIRVLSLYAFSTENWNRSEEEVSALMELVLEFFSKEIDELDAENVNIRILGNLEEMPPQQRSVLLLAQERTAYNTGLQLNIALNYGGRAEIVRAAKRIAADLQNAKIAEEEITDDLFSAYLYTSSQPDVDLLIRTGGEQRLSNFLLYQNAYAEFVFTDVLWPDFSVEDLHSALNEYLSRQRRFGG